MINRDLSQYVRGTVGENSFGEEGFPITLRIYGDNPDLSTNNRGYSLEEKLSLKFSFPNFLTFFSNRGFIPLLLKNH